MTGVSIRLPIKLLGCVALLLASQQLLAAGSAAEAHAGKHAHDKHQQHHHHHHHQHPPPASPARLELLDLPLLDHTGEARLFRSEVIGDQVVAMTVVFTSCTTVCPVISAVFQQVQDSLGDRLGADVALLSISVDPLRDTPEQLARYRERFKARDGWVWLTGPRPDVAAVLTGLGAWSPEPENHPVMVLVGDGRRDTWERHYGMPSPGEVVGWLDDALAARGH